MNKRMKTERIDRLSALPDPLLTHILAFLEPKDAAITCVLSKRWQFLWTELPRLVFCDHWWKREDIGEFVARIHRTLDIYGKNNLERFEVEFTYFERFSSDMDVWVEFAVKNKVKEVVLRLNHVHGDFYTLPQMMYSNSSWTSLSLQRCIVTPQKSIEWPSLTSLSLDYVELPGRAIEKILSGCPVLHSLVLHNCWKYNCFEINSPSFYKLAIFDPEDDNEPLLKISAPYVRFLNIELSPVEKQLHLINIPSVVSVYIEFTEFGRDSSSEQVTSNAKEVLEKTKHVKALKLGVMFVEVVSKLVVKGWRLPQSTRSWLRISALITRDHNTSGIIGLLESSPNIETLFIDICHMFFGSQEPITVIWDYDLDCDLLHLKTVDIKCSIQSNLGSDQILALARILLKRATILEEMVIVTDLENKSELVKISQTLLAYPRSSLKAVVVLR